MDQLSLNYKSEENPEGLDRDSLIELAGALGLSEEGVVHLALARLANQLWPSYEKDDGPLSQEYLKYLKEDAEQFKIQGSTLIKKSSLFD